jgi:hypothetical protein
MDVRNLDCERDTKASKENDHQKMTLNRVARMLVKFFLVVKAINQYLSGRNGLHLYPLIKYLSKHRPSQLWGS